MKLIKGLGVKHKTHKLMKTFCVIALAISLLASCAPSKYAYHKKAAKCNKIGCGLVSR